MTLKQFAKFLHSKYNALDEQGQPVPPLPVTKQEYSAVGELSDYDIVLILKELQVMYGTTQIS